MNELTEIVNLAQGGVVAILVAAVVALWRRLNDVTDRFTTYLEESAREGDVAAQRVLQEKAGRDGSKAS